jgi:hypothetical protein
MVFFPFCKKQKAAYPILAASGLATIVEKTI